jgi:hypothetical protein
MAELLRDPRLDCRPDLRRQHEFLARNSALDDPSHRTQPPPLTLLQPVTWSTGTQLGMLAVRGYLIIGAVLLIVKAIQLGRG